MGQTRQGNKTSFANYCLIIMGEGKDKIEETKGVGEKVTKI